MLKNNINKQLHDNNHKFDYVFIYVQIVTETDQEFESQK